MPPSARAHTQTAGFPWPPWPAGPPGPPGPPGSGAFRGTTVVFGATPTLQEIGGDTQVRFTGWSNTPYVDSELHPAIAPGTADPVLAGWYQIKWSLLLEFTNPAEYPQSLRFEQKGYYDEVGLIADLDTFNSDVLAGFRFRTKPGIQTALTTGIFFQPAYGSVPGPTINPLLFWEGSGWPVTRLLLEGEISLLGLPIPLVVPVA